MLLYQANKADIHKHIQTQIAIEFNPFPHTTNLIQLTLKTSKQKFVLPQMFKSSATEASENVCMFKSVKIH